MNGMSSTLKRTNSVRDGPDPEGDRPAKNRRIQNDDQEIEEEVEEMEYSQSDSEEEGDDDEGPRNTQGGGNRLDRPIDYDNFDINLAGTIARVEVVNFMCHKYLKVDFGPKINFVIGHNGSGKSAILTAITLALGANASATNRGKNLSNFIKEGSSAASITIHLTNGGPAPYKPDLFPGVIVIERKLNKDGASPYKLKNASGRVVSYKKEDLIAVLDNFGILVNNPLTMLTQDMARKFLSDSTPEDKYKLFMHGTQLTQLRQDYEVVRESLETAKQTLERKNEGMPKLHAEANEKQRRLQECDRIGRIEEELERLSAEMVWSQIIHKEKEAQRTFGEMEIAKGKMEEVEQSCAVQKEQIDRVNKNIEEVNNEWELFKNQPDPNAEEKEQMTQANIKNKVDLGEFKDTLTDINNRIKETRVQKEKHEKLLKIETDKLEASSRLKRNEISEEINQLKAKMEEKVKKTKRFSSEQRELEGQIQKLKDDRTSIQRECANIRGRMEGSQRIISDLNDQRTDRMKAYGHNMPKVLGDIRRESRWRKRRPVGPLGATLQLLHPQYSDTLEIFFSKTLNAFIVECFEDKNLLFHILSRHKMQYTTIYVAEYDLFDYSSGEPDQKYLTVLRAIKFEDEWVKRQLIIANKIEKTLLMEERAEADEVMYRKPHNIHMCFTSSGHKVGGKSGMKTETLEPYRGPPRFKADVDTEIRKQQGRLQELKASYTDLEQQERRLRDEIVELDKQQRQCRNNENRLTLEIKALERKVEEKEDTLKEDDPVDLNMYEENIKECVESMKSFAQQFQSIKAQQEKAIAESKEILKGLHALQVKEEGREKISNEFSVKINKLQAIKTKVYGKLEEQSNQRHNLRARYERLKSTYNEQLGLAAQWTEECRDEYPDRVHTDRDPHTINADITRLHATAESLEREMGQSHDEMKREAALAAEAYTNAKAVIESMEKLSRTLRRMLVRRNEKWEAFRGFMALSASHYFRHYLYMRGDEGALKFNHQTKRLELRVSTGDQYRKGSRQKDSRSLSGGEKSFSQISLLLSLWQSISSPIICLDEFDVFMDAVNRKQTMEMIMNAAHDNSSQYILITPQDASNMVPGKFVTIHRLADPER